MPRLTFEQWPIIAVYQQLGDQIISDYEVYYRDRKVFRIATAGRFDNLYRVYYSRVEYVTVDKHAMCKVGV